VKLRMNWVLNIHNHSISYLNPRQNKHRWNFELHSIEKKRTHNKGFCNIGADGITMTICNSISLLFGQTIFNLAFFCYLQYFNWAAVPGERFSNPLTSQSLIVRGNFMTTIKTTIFFLLLTTFVFGQDRSFDTTLVINKMTFHIKTIAINSDLLLFTSTCWTETTLVDTIESGGLAYIKYLDFNKDGNADILMDYYGNNSTYFLYLFDPTTKKFIEIENYSSFPDAIQLKANAKYSYSYQSWLCRHEMGKRPF
jgi:hypothetical protein